MKMTRLSYKCPESLPDKDFEMILKNFMLNQGWKYDGTGMNYMTIPPTRDVWFYKKYWYDPILKFFRSVHIFFIKKFNKDISKTYPPIDENNFELFEDEG